MVAVCELVVGGDAGCWSAVGLKAKAALFVLVGDDEPLVQWQLEWK